MFFLSTCDGHAVYSFRFIQDHLVDYFAEILSGLFLHRELWSRHRGGAGRGGMVCWTLSMVADARAVVMEVAFLLLYAAPEL